MEKSVILFIMATVSVIAISSCSKNKCHDCHYDKNVAEVELGEKCGDDLEQLESNGYTDTTGTYTVHCHEH